MESITAASQTKRPGRMTAAERKKQIVEATAAIVAEYGVHGATTARIAAASGIAEKTLYSHFPSRRDILIAAMDSIFERARDAFRSRTETNALEELRAAARRHWPSGQEFVHPLFEFFAAPPEAGLREELRIRHQASVDFLVDIVEEGKAQGVIRSDVDSEQTAWEYFGVYWAEDVAYMIGFDEFASSGRSTIMLERILRDISAES
jgi:AcrR family transcriptional regulator